MKKVIFIAIMLSGTINQGIIQAELLSAKEIRSAEGKPTLENMQNLEDYLRQDLKDVKATGDFNDVDVIERMLQKFYRGKFDEVIAEIKRRGDKIQDILKISGLREKMLSGELERIPWFMKEIAGLDWFFERDANRKQSEKLWPQPKDKVQYLGNLTDQIERNHSRVSDTVMLHEAIDELGGRLSGLRDSVSNIMKRSIDQALEKLRLVEEIRHLVGPSQIKR
jgi:hypothetical protein